MSGAPDLPGTMLTFVIAGVVAFMAYAIFSGLVDASTLDGAARATGIGILEDASTAIKLAVPGSVLAVVASLVWLASGGRGR